MEVMLRPARVIKWPSACEDNQQVGGKIRALSSQSVKLAAFSCKQVLRWVLPFLD